MDLESFRKSRGLSQAQLAIELGLVSKGYVSRLERGVTPYPVTLALRIEAWSGGAIRAFELIDEEHAAFLRASIARGVATTNRDDSEPSKSQAA
jgi:transcriptional regulator with XRE-family HTH domain